MVAAIWPNAENCSRAELETAMRAAPRQAAFARMQAIHSLLRGLNHAAVAAFVNVRRETLNRWIKKFNARGVDGLIDAPRAGRPAHITPEQKQHYRELIEHPEQAGQAHWTAKKFCGYLRERLDHAVGYRTLVRWLHEEGFRLKVPQPWPDRQDEAARAAFVGRVKTWLADERIDLWYQDEMGVEGDPRPRRRWIQKGEKGRVTRNGDHIRMNVSGVVCPRTGQFFALELSHSDGEMFQIFLDEANKDLRLERPRNLLIMDNASWHKNKRTRWGAFEPVYLPSYSPDLNPIERLWLLVKAEWFSDFIAKTREALMDRLDLALRWVIGRAEDNQRTCRIKVEL
jgi:transposase